MLEFQEKRRLKKILYSPFILVILIIILILMFRAVWGIYIKNDFTKHNLDRVNDDYYNLKQREEKLIDEISFLKTTDGQEEELREKYGVAKPNEEVIIIVNQNQKLVDDWTEPINWWQKIKLWFK